MSHMWDMATDSQNSIKGYPQLQLKQSTELGRYFAGSRAFRPGEIVMREFPLAVGPGPLAEHVCFGCHRIFSKAYFCSKCRSPLCDRNCESSMDHQNDCQYLQRIVQDMDKRNSKGNEGQRIPLKLNLLILPLRLLVLRHEQPEKWNLLMDLEAHLEARKKTQTWGFIERNITPYLQVMLREKMPDLSNLLVQQVCGIIDVNSFEIRVQSASRLRLDLPEPLLN